MRKEIERLSTLVSEVDVDAIPDVLGAIKALEARLLQRLVAPVPGPDRLMTAEEVASRLCASVPFVYTHADELGGCRLSERMLRFRESDVERYVKHATV
jgi:predicted DNA-binding transcriptional regulator AlpA